MADLANLTSWCSQGNLDDITHFFNKGPPEILKDGQVQLQTPGSGTLQTIPYKLLLTRLLNTASEAGQVEVFEYLWDGFLKPQGIQIPWDSLKAAARQGSLQLAEAIRQREPNFFARGEPKGPRGSQLGNTQIKVALRCGNLHYVDYLLSLGADINENFPEQSPIRATVRAEIEDGMLPSIQLFSFKLTYSLFRYCNAAHTLSGRERSLGEGIWGFKRSSSYREIWRCPIPARAWRRH